MDFQENRRPDEQETGSAQQPSSPADNNNTPQAENNGASPQQNGQPCQNRPPCGNGTPIRLRSSHTRIRTAPGSRPTEIFGTIHDQTRRNLIETICHTAAAIRTKIRIHTRMDIVPAITVSKTVLRTIIHIITGALISCLFRYRAVILPKPL